MADTNWIVLTGQDLLQVLSHLVVDGANQNIDADSEEGDPLDESRPNRVDSLMKLAVAEVRGAIQSAGRFPLSVTPGAVPALAAPHTLYLAAWRLLISTPNLQMVVIEEQPVAKQFYDKAEKFVEGLTKGGTIDPPNDPTGVDYSTAVSDTNPAISAVKYGDLYATDQEYAQGYRVLPNGSTQSLPVDDMTMT